MTRKRKPQNKIVLGILVMKDVDGNDVPIKIKGHPRNVKKRAELLKLQQELEQTNE